MAQVTLTVRGDKVHAVHTAPPGSAKGAVILLHGFNSDLRELGDWPDRLAAAGYHTLAFDQRGFGGSAGPPARTTMVGVMEETEAAALWIKTNLGNVPLAVLGHSLGGQYAVAAAAKPGHPFVCMVAAHPVDALWDELNLVEKAGYAVLGGIAIKRVAQGKSAGTIPFKVRYKDLFEDKAAMAHAAALGYLRKTVDLGNYDAARHQRASELAPGVKVPALVIQSPHDQVVRPQSSRAVFEALGGEKVWLEHSGGHSCALDKDGGIVAAAIVGFLDQHMAHEAPGAN